MRLVQVMIPAGKREAVLGVLDEEKIDYALTDEVSGREYTALVTFPVPTGAVEPVLEQLREVGIERDAYTVVLSAETVVSKRFEQLTERYAAQEDSDDRIAREELKTRAEEMAPRWTPFVVLTVISAVVATAGLLLDSPAVVVGSMVIAPLIGPAMATSVGTVLDEAEMFRRGVRLQVAGGLLAVASAAGFAFALRYTQTVPLAPGEVFAIGEIRERLVPDVLSLPIALGAGVAGALSLSSGVSSALVGVMIAAALVPPTAVVGIGLAWGAPQTVVGAVVLVIVNFLSINFAALATLWYEGYRPERFFRLDEARTATITRVVVLGAAILVATTFLVGVTFASFQTATFEDTARTEVEAVLADTPFISLDVDVLYSGFPLRKPERVVVTVGHPPGLDPPPLAEQFAARLGPEARAPYGIGGASEITVEVRFVAIQTADT